MFTQMCIGFNQRFSSRSANSSLCQLFTQFFLKKKNYFVCFPSIACTTQCRFMIHFSIAIQRSTMQRRILQQQSSPNQLVFKNSTIFLDQFHPASPLGAPVGNTLCQREPSNVECLLEVAVDAERWYNMDFSNNNSPKKKNLVSTNHLVVLLTWWIKHSYWTGRSAHNAEIVIGRCDNDFSFWSIVAKRPLHFGIAAQNEAWMQENTIGSIVRAGAIVTGSVSLISTVHSNVLIAIGFKHMSKA